MTNDDDGLLKSGSPLRGENHDAQRRHSASRHVVLPATVEESDDILHGAIIQCVNRFGQLIGCVWTQHDVLAFQQSAGIRLDVAAACRPTI